MQLGQKGRTGDLLERIKRKFSFSVVFSSSIKMFALILLFAGKSGHSLSDFRHHVNLLRAVGSNPSPLLAHICDGQKSAEAAAGGKGQSAGEKSFLNTTVWTKSQAIVVVAR